MPVNYAPVVQVPPDRVDAKVIAIPQGIEWISALQNVEKAAMSSWLIINRSDRTLEWSFSENVDATKIFEIGPGGSRAMSVQVADIFVRLKAGQVLGEGEVPRIEVFVFFLPVQCRKQGDNVNALG